MNFQTVIKDVKTRVIKSLGQEIPVMILLWNIYRIIVINSVKENMKNLKNARSHALTPVPFYLLRPIRTSWTLTSVKTPVRPLANIVRPAPIRNILVVPRTEWRCVTTLTSGVTDIPSVMEQLMSRWIM